MAQENKDPKSDSDEGPLHSWEFDSDWDGKNKQIIIRVSDHGEKKRNWKLKLGTETYPNPGKEYDDMVNVFNDEDVDFECKINKSDGDLFVVFKQGKVQLYKFWLQPCKK